MVGKKKYLQFEGQKSKANAALMSLGQINIVIQGHHTDAIRKS